MEANKIRHDFPFFNSRRYKLTLSLGCTFFFYFFLVFFLPFGVSNYDPYHEYTLTFLLEILKFALVMICLLLLNEFWIKPLIVKNNQLNSVLLWSLWTFILIGTATFLTYNYLGNWHDFKLISYFGFIVNVASVLLFPMLGTFFYFRHRSLQNKYEQILTNKGKWNDDNPLIRFKGQGSKDEISLSVNSFIYGRSQDNYVELYYAEKDDIKRFLIRTPLSKLARSLDHEAMVRCHRSYLVNLFQVKTIKGASYDMSLILEPADQKIPVSGSYRSQIIERLQKLKEFN